MVRGMVIWIRLGIAYQATVYNVWWIMGGVFGEVGDGRMIWSLNTARRALSFGGLNGSDSFSVLVARMED